MVTNRIGRGRLARARLTRVHAGCALAVAVAAAVTAQGCSAQPGEEVRSVAAAVGPEGEFGPKGVGYTIGIQEIDVLSVTEAPSLSTYDTGYSEWGELAVRVDHLDPVTGANVKGAVNPVQCDYGSVSSGTVLTNCANSPQGALWTNGPLELPLTVYSPTDTVNVGIALDNIEQNDPTGLNPTLGTALAGIGNAGQAAGGAVTLAEGSTAAGAAWAAGPVVGILGSIISIASVFAEAPGAPKPYITCFGGLLESSPPGSTPFIPKFNAKTMGTKDTLYISFTPQDLENRTLGGTQPATYELDAAVGVPGVYCNSSHRIILSITRDWTTGPAVSPKSGDSATVDFSEGNMPTSATSTPTSEIDSLWGGASLAGVQGAGSGIEVRFGEGGGTVVTAGGDALSSPTWIASISRAPRFLDAFWVNQFGTLETMPWTAATNTTQAHTVVNAGSIPANARLSVSARTPNNLDVFYIGNNGALDTNFWSAGGTWSPVVSGSVIPGPISATKIAPPGGGVAAVARRPDTEDVIFTGNLGEVYWSSWSSVAGWNTYAIAPAGTAIKAGGSVTMVAQSSQQLDAFFVGQSGAVYRSSWTQAASAEPNHGWTTVPVTPAGTSQGGAPISAVSRLLGSVDVVFNTSDSSGGGAIDWISLTPANTFTAPVAITASYMEGPLSIVASNSAQLDVFGNDTALRTWTAHLNVSDQTWSTNLVPPWWMGPVSSAAGDPEPAAETGSRITSYVTSWNNERHYDYVGIDGHVHDLMFDWEWHATDLTAATGATAPASNSRIAGYVSSWNSEQHVVYIGADAHVYELMYDTAWHATDLTRAAGAPAAVTYGGLDAFTWDAWTQQHINFIDVNGHVHELVGDSPWGTNDLTAKTGAPPAFTNSALDGYVSAWNDQQHINFIDPSGHVHELMFDTAAWHTADLTAATGAPAAVTFGGLDGYTSGWSNQQHVNFIGVDTHVYELMCDSSWHLGNLTALAGAPDASIFSTLSGYVTTWNGQQHVIFVGADSDVYELMYGPSWFATDLTAQSVVVANVPPHLTVGALAGVAATWNSTEYVGYVATDGSLQELFY